MDEHGLQRSVNECMFIINTGRSSEVPLINAPITKAELTQYSFNIYLTLVKSIYQELFIMRQGFNKLHYQLVSNVYS